MDGVVGRGTVLTGRYQLRDPRPCDLPGTTEWGAVDQILVRPVLVRMFPAEGSGAALDAARRAALVSDPRLVRVLDVGVHDDLGYVVSEQVGGLTLAQLVSREPLSADQARAVVGEAAAALETARRRGVHHLALRPSSVAVSDDGRVLVGGLALDSTLLGLTGGDARSTSRTDATGLVRLVYTALTGHWPGPVATSDGLPTAPQTDGTPVPPSDLAPGVPPDLDTLCRVTLGRDDDGPHSPAEVVRELEPWGEIKVARPVSPPALATPPAPSGAAPATEPGQVVRQSVRTAFSGANPTANRPGTPPVATPDRTVPAAPAVPTTAAPVTPSAAPVTPSNGLPPAVPPPGPLGLGPEDTAPVPVTAAAAAPSFQPAAYAPPFPAEPPEEDPFDFGTMDDGEPPRRVGMAIAIAVVGLLVVVALGFGIKALLGGVGRAAEPGAASSSSASPTSAGDGGTASTSGAASSAATPTPTPTQVDTGAAPVVAGITSIDPSDTDGEHEEAVGKAIDGDPGTYWFSQTYNRDDFAGIKPGVGLALTLAEPATVRTVTLHVNGTGGQVEVYAADATDPTAGPVLASGTLGPDTVLTLDPATSGSSFVVWFTQLPTNSAGLFRIELTELELG